MRAGDISINIKECQNFKRDFITDTLLMSQKIYFLYFAQMGHSVEKQVIKESKYRYRAEYLDHIDFPLTAQSNKLEYLCALKYPC